MDVTFASSGALSRAHYSIVRKVETAQSVHQADQFLALEAKVVHERLSRSSLSVKACKECLVMLMYISTTASPGFLPPGSFDFALAHALNLVEAGKSIEDKRIGYLFCAELMAPHHELRLMMVNTLRKDLESGSPGRMCLALDNIVTFANEDIVPAVQDAVLDLISHNYPHVRRRAVLALRSLAVFNPDLLSQSSGTIVARLQDRNEAVVGSALIAAAQLPSSDPSFSNARHVVNGLFSSVSISTRSAISLRVIHCLQGMGLSEGHVPFAIDLLNSFSSSREPVLLLGIFRLLSQQTPSKLMEAEKAQGTSCVGSIQNLLASHDINDQYLYLACLTCIDPVIWAGTSPDRPLVLEGWEVEKIMQFLESPDDSIRKMV
ncbi:hypothetical protein EST38_g2524 [Candolleomyces aberdarensis]|uniref:Clathrin/coatomer adaptor adaptin-like N-terminal domain-containing protein n=1 Tax=Candolleomyces aberdarensis TaxID=2316362 RepID=A0A4Q2DUJ1_9AGAR|nr:hypothetical protein EST38_g2524 [Candolleomyces aberdarensis]